MVDDDDSKVLVASEFKGVEVGSVEFGFTEVVVIEELEPETDGSELLVGSVCAVVTLPGDDSSTLVVVDSSVGKAEALVVVALLPVFVELASLGVESAAAETRVSLESDCLLADSELG